VKASYDNGVTITIPVSQQARPRKIDIGSGSGAIDVGGSQNSTPPASRTLAGGDGRS